MQHTVSYSVYYEDTDCLGVVYYACLLYTSDAADE